jgi:hypothetical protein
VQAVCYNEPAAGVQNSCDTPFDDAGKICAAGLLTDQQSTCCLSAVTPQRAIINIDSAGSVTHELAAGVQNSCDTLFDDAGKIWCCRTAHRPAVNMLLSAVTPQRAINIASAGSVIQMNQQQHKFM